VVHVWLGTQALSSKLVFYRWNYFKIAIVQLLMMLLLNIALLRRYSNTMTFWNEGNSTVTRMLLDQSSTSAIHHTIRVEASKVYFWGSQLTLKIFPLCCFFIFRLVHSTLMGRYLLQSRSSSMYT
jgi:hypothetical protein